MDPNPVVGVFYHWSGGLASGSFYVPFRGVKRWSWETFWLTGGFFSWIIAPWFFALLITEDLWAVFSETPASTLFWTMFFGLLWGVGGLTFGLTMRFLGLSLGFAMVLGLCAAFGTLIPPIFRGEFMTQVIGTTSGRVILLGVFVCLLGIAVAGLAGISKERVMSPEQKKLVIREFNLKKGVGVAVLSGVMSSCFAFALAAGDPIKELTIKHGTSPLWQGLPVLVVILIGGFATNFVWCVLLSVRNKTGYQYYSLTSRTPDDDQRVPVISNYLLCALAGTTWYFQFFFYTMGETQMGAYKFSSWTLHMASIIIFSNLWGIGFKEWKGAGVQAGRLLALALVMLVGSTMIVGYGNYLALAR
jgi:L-rhamnose-H+ transport protein